MDYLTQYYKNYYLQLQEQLNHLTKMLNEVTGPPRPPRPHRVPGSMGWSDNLPAGHRFPVIVSTTLGSEWASNLQRFLNMAPDELYWLLRRENDAFADYVRGHYGIVIHRGNNFERMLSDGTVERWIVGQGWIPINKPNTDTLFGRIDKNGRISPIRVVPDQTIGSPNIPGWSPKPPFNTTGWVPPIGGGGIGTQTGGPVK